MSIKMLPLKSCPFKPVEIFVPQTLRAVLIFLVIALIACLPAHPQATKAPAYRIAGTVVNSTTGEPVRRATVAVLSNFDADRQTVASVETDNEGRFAIDGLPAAKYPLTAAKRGFLTASYDEHDGRFSTAIVTGADQETSGLVFRLVPGASLHGEVSSDGGDPVEGAKVMLFLKPHTHNHGARITLVAETTTDDTGAYEFDGMAAGEYLVAVSAKPWYALQSSASGSRQRPTGDAGAALDVAYPVTFFDSTTDESAAIPIVLAGGSRDEANLILRVVPALHLTIETPHKEDNRVARSVLRRAIFGIVTSSEAMGKSFGSQRGTDEYDGLAPGHYELTQGDPPRIAEIDATSSQQIDPNMGTPTVAVAGSLRASNGTALSENLGIILKSLDEAQPHAPQQTGCDNGSFSFAAVPPGRWEVWADNPGKPLTITSLTIGSHPHAGNEFTVRDKPLSLTATVSLSETRVEGFARKQGKGVSGVMVVLVPREQSAFRSLVRRDQSDSDGSFSLRNVAPGQYTAVAIEDGWELNGELQENIRRYLSQGVAVTVTESSGKLLRLSEALPVQRR